ILSFNYVLVYGDDNFTAKSYLLMDYNSGKIILANNEHDKLPPASITKIMTLLIAMEYIDNGTINLDDRVIVSESASKAIGTSVYLDAGEVQTVENLLKAISIRSANDASIALAVHIAGSEEAFVDLMNERASQLGMENTHFNNSNGLPVNNHYTSAYDIALMSRELMKYESIVPYLTTWMEDLEVGKQKKSVQTMVNTNRLIKDYEGANGIKTGSTSEAKYCISASAKRGDLQLIAVIMGADSSSLRFSEAQRLLDNGFSNYESVTIGKEGEVVANILVEKGKLDVLPIVLERDSHILLTKSRDNKIEKDLIYPETIKAPIDKGQIIGELVVKLDGDEIERVNLMAKSEVAKASYARILKNVWNNFLFNK
ncbi:MAG TPA: D-alanyl-D-alanine carboxypeptidase family protein, partial [Tissierellaceae bacterium]|nr:D-alanyl-D-alanine carboxypeptidase family protein [Tissierellaceae bacterium]